MLDGVGALPAGWAWARLDKFVGGGTLTVNPANRPDVTFTLYSVPAHAEGKPETCKGHAIGSSKVSVTPGTVLLCKINPRINRVWVVADRGGPEPDLIASTEWITFPPHTAFVPEYLRFFLMREPVRAFLAASASGVGGSLMRSNAGVAGTLSLPLAPLPEQHRVVAAIEAQFAELDEAEAALARARAGLAEYRASLLHAACTGQLTAAWRVSRPPPAEDGPALLRRILAERRAAWERAELARLHARGKPAPIGEGWKARYQEPAMPETMDLPELPADWAWASLDQLCSIVGGITVDAKRTGDDLTTIPYLRVANVQRGRLDLSQVKTIQAPAERVQALRLVANDVLLNEGGDRDKVGRGWVWSGELADCIHQNHVFRGRPYLSDINGRFISHYLNEIGRAYFLDAAIQTTNLASISMAKVSRVPVPVPPLTELHQIMALVTSCLEEVQADEALASGIATLRQSILHAAFTGRLVPQDPADEPAAALLARLRAAPAAPRRGRAPGRVPPPQPAPTT